VTQTYEGACHCGRITFEARAQLNYAVDCNCLICRRTGALWHPAAEADLHVLTGEPDLVLYQFNTKRAKHYFCRYCGIHPFIRPRLDPSHWAFNVRCIDGIEATAKAYYDRLKRPPAA
jgi:hypothetical protein